MYNLLFEKLVTTPPISHTATPIWKRLEAGLFAVVNYNPQIFNFSGVEIPHVKEVIDENTVYCLRVILFSVSWFSSVE